MSHPGSSRNATTHLWLVKLEMNTSLERRLHLYPLFGFTTLHQQAAISKRNSVLFPDRGRIRMTRNFPMPDSLYGVRLQGIMVDVFIKPCTRLSNDEYNYRESLQARAIEGIGHLSFSCPFSSAAQASQHDTRKASCVCLHLQALSLVGTFSFLRI